MKKILTLVITLVFALTLSGCQTDVEITPDTIDVQFENVRWEGDSIVVDVWITNGYDSDYYLEYMEFGLFYPNEETEVCGSGFDILDTIKSNGYLDFEIEFTSEYVYKTASELNRDELSLDDLVLYFWYEN